ncbi:MAB_1171c family putative transporter [Streptomyces longwoodensis]|uniref:MAB_1171c family putative transporter n=1 Tax=Streptomyces longwoodensis TaxID=68231 RepID=UPI0036F61909
MMYVLPTAVLLAALVIKLPTIVRLWQDPLLRAVGGLLLLACAVFVFVTPATIRWTNRVTGVPNFSAPLVYSLLTAFSGSGLLLILAWRDGLAGRSAATRRAMRQVVCGYAAVVVALWVLFALADAPVERVRDLDTYYATTPFLREEILLYLLAHTVAVLVTGRLVWNWVRADGLDAWLRWGLTSLGAGYALNLCFDACKFTAVGARLTGHDLDWLSTRAAPPAACLSAVLIAVGFILPHAGQYLHERWLLRRAHRHLRPLYALMRSAGGGRAPLLLRASAELRLTRRETYIRDALLPLARRLDEELHARAHDAALALGHPPSRARALAAAVAVLDAVAAGDRRPAHGTGADRDTTALLREIGPISRALRDTDALAAVRARATGGEGTGRRGGRRTRALEGLRRRGFRRPAAERTRGGRPVPEGSARERSGHERSGREYHANGA